MSTAPNISFVPLRISLHSSEGTNEFVLHATHEEWAVLVRTARISQRPEQKRGYAPFMEVSEVKS